MTRRFAFLLLPLLVVACQDMPEPTLPADDTGAALGSLERSPHAPQDLAVWFARSSPEVLALPQTVFADHDEAGNRLVFGVEHPGVTRGVEGVLARHRVPGSAYRIQIVEPIHFMSDNLRSEHRPTVGGIQLHWDSYACTLGFNVSHSGGRSFITNSHCTTEQGRNSGTIYNQPSRSESPDPIADEVDDPAYSGLSDCSSGRRCRYSDAARAKYRNEAESTQGAIAKTTGVNNGSLSVAGRFTITDEDQSSTSFSGTLHKVGRTTGWTSGNVTNTCATVNVSGSDIQLLCQTLVQRRGRQIVSGGDSGSPVFRITSGDDVELTGILWGGSINGDLFVFSPLKGIRDELGAFDATTDGTGGGNGDKDEDDGPNCPPNSNNPRC